MQPVLWIHIAAGMTGLVLVPILAFGAKGAPRHVVLGKTFVWALRIVAATAVALAVADLSGLWWFVPIAAFSWALGERGAAAIRRRPQRAALYAHVTGMGGACIAFVTAFTVTNVDSVWAWAVPTLVGSPIVTWAARRAARHGVRRRVARTGLRSGSA